MSRALPSVLLFLGLAWFRAGPDYWCDDAFISFRYARNLVEGHGLVYNPGTPVEGYTNFLWTLVAAGALAVGVEPIRAAQGLSLLLGVVTLLALLRLARPLGRGALLPPLLLALDAGFVGYPMTGMETTAFTAAATLAFLALAAGRRGWAGVALLAVGLLRFDGFVLIGILLSAQGFFAGGWRRLLLPALVAGVGLLLYNLWRLSYYPTWLPNTFYAKIGFTPARFLDGVRYAGTFVAREAVVLVPAALAGVLLGGLTPRVRRCLWVLLAHGAYVVAVGGDWMPHDRFFLPVLPLLCLLAGEGLLRVGSLLRAALPAPRRPGWWLLGATVLAVHAVPLGEWRAFARLSSPWFQPQEGEILGRGLAELLPRKTLVAIEWGGIVPYYLPQPVLDTWGIADREIAASAFPRRITGRQISLAYLAARRPDVVLPCVRVFRDPEAARAAVAPGGVCRYRQYMDLAGPKYGYALEVVPLAGGWWAPVLLRRGFRPGR